MGPLLEINNVEKIFDISGRGQLMAVRNVTANIFQGDIIGIVGESGSGKTTLARMIMLLSRPTSGSIKFKGKNISSMPESQLRSIRPSFQMVFQDPRDALDPRMKIFESIAENLRVAEPSTQENVIKMRVIDAAELAAFPLFLLDRYPHQMSAGEQQRACIARSIVTRPELIVLDEPTAMLDASLRVEIIATLKKLHESLGLTIIFITHDFLSVAVLTNRIAVMYLGEIVEIGNTRCILENPLHPYTQALLSSIPLAILDAPSPMIMLSGEVPSPLDRPKGCSLSGRCPYTLVSCCNEKPSLISTYENHLVSCFRINEMTQLNNQTTTPGRWLARYLDQ